MVLHREGKELTNMRGSRAYVLHGLHGLHRLLNLGDGLETLLLVLIVCIWDCGVLRAE